MLRFYKNERHALAVFEIDRDGETVTCRQGLRGGEISETERKSHGDAAAARAAVKALVKEREADGWTLAQSPEPAAVRFARDEFLDLLVGSYGVSRGEPSDHLIRECEDLYGQKMPGELAAHLELRGSNELGWCNFGEWRIWADDLIPFDLEDGTNLFEQLLARFSSYSLRMMLSDMVQFGTAGNGDCYLAFLDVTQPDCPPVYLFDHEEGDVHPFCDAVSTLAELNRLYELHAGSIECRGDLLATLRTEMARIAARISPSWHYRQLVETSGCEPSFEGKSAAEFFWFRTGWIKALMEGDVREAGQWFEPIASWHEEHMDAASWADGREYGSFLLPSRGIYWLYTLYMFDRPELGETVTRLAASPSRLVRDAAAIFGELAAGRTHVGELDFAETRRRFAALGLDPAQAAAKREAEAAEKAARLAGRAADRAQARREWGEASAEKIAAAMWQHLHAPALVGELAAMLAEKSETAALAHQRARVCLERAEHSDASLEALLISPEPIERAMLALLVSQCDLYLIGEVLRELNEGELAAVRGCEAIVSRLRQWMWAKYGKAGAIRGLAALGAIDRELAEKLVARLSWSKDEDEDEDDDENEDEDDEASAATARSAFGERLVGAAIFQVVNEDDEAGEDEDEDEDEDGDENGDGEDDDPDDENDDDRDDGDDDEDENEDEEDENDEDEDENADEDENDEDENDDEEDEDEENVDEENVDDDEDDEQEAAEDEEPRFPFEASVELDEENPLVEEPAYLKSITAKEPLRVVIEALATCEGSWALPLLVGLLDRGPKEVRPAVLIALASQPAAAARDALIAALDTPSSRIALYALAKRGDPSALPAVESFLGKRRGLHHSVVFESTMLEALRSAAGHEVDLSVARLALETMMDIKFAATELHEVAVALVAMHASSAERRRLLEPFIDAEQYRVRAFVWRALDIKPVILDDVLARQLIANGGPEALRRALSDRRAVRRDRLIAVASAEGVLAEIEDAAIAVVAELARFPYYPCGYERDSFEHMSNSISALFPLETRTAREFLHALANSPSAALRKPFEYEDDLNEALAAIGPIEPREQLDAAFNRNLEVGIRAEPLFASRFVLGADVHAIDFTRDAVIVGGGGRLSAFNRDGTAHPNSGALTDGWAYDIAISTDRGLLAVGYSHGHCVVHDLATFAKIKDIGHGSCGVRKLVFSPSSRWLATACDNKTLNIIDTETLEIVRTHTEPYDVNTAAWLDEDAIAFATDNHVGIVGREGGEARRFDSGSVAELQVIGGGDLLVGTSKHGLIVLSPSDFSIKESLPVTGVARARLTREGRTVWVACWTGDHEGLSVWDRETRRGVQVNGESLFGLGIDDVEHGRRVFCGGKSGRLSAVAQVCPECRGPLSLLRQEGALHHLCTSCGGMFDPVAFANDGSHHKAAPSEHGVSQIDSAISAIRPTPSSFADRGFDILTGSGELIHYSDKTKAGEVVANAGDSLGSTDDFVRRQGDAFVAAGDHIYCLTKRGPSWARKTDRCERVIAFDDAIVAASGKRLGWFDGEGNLIAEADTGVDSSWIHYMFRVTADLFFVAGYDEGRLQLWSSSKRARVSEFASNHRHDDGRFARPYGMSVHAPTARVVVAYWDNEVDVFSTEGGVLRLEHTLILDEQYEFIEIAPDGKTLIGGDEVKVVAYAYPDPAPLWRWPATSALTTMTVLDDSSVVVGGKDGAVIRLTAGLAATYS